MAWTNASLSSFWRLCNWWILNWALCSQFWLTKCPFPPSTWVQLVLSCSNIITRANKNKSIQKDIWIVLDYFKIRTFPKIRKMLEKNRQSACKYALIPRELGVIESSCNIILPTLFWWRKLTTVLRHRGINLIILSRVESPAAVVARVRGLAAVASPHECDYHCRRGFNEWKDYPVETEFRKSSIPPKQSGYYGFL